MKKAAYFLLLALLILVPSSSEAMKKKKNRFPRAFIDFEGRRTTRLNDVAAPPLDKPEFDFRVSRNFKNGKRVGAVVFFNRGADISPGNSFPIQGNFSDGNFGQRNDVAVISTSFEFGKGSKRRRFEANNAEGTVSIITDERTGVNFLLVRAETKNGKIYRIDNNGDSRELIKEKDLFWEMDIPFVYGYITRYQRDCFELRDGNTGGDCVTSVNEVNSF